MVWQDITLKKYLRVILGMALIVASIPFLLISNIWIISLQLVFYFLLLEHIYTWQEFSFKDWIGHEWVGLVGIITISLIFSINWIGLLLFITGALINFNFKTPLKNEFKRLKNDR